MTFRRILTYAFALSSLSLAACVEEDPIGIGDELLPSGGVVTFEVLLPASEFLVFDSAFSGYEKPFNATFSIVANDFENVLDSHMLLRFIALPRSITVRTTGTATVADSNATFGAGRLVLRIDTLRTEPGPVSLRIFNITEEWSSTATWTHRIDSATVRQLWATPGGTRGTEAATAMWSEGDSIVFDVDSQTVALWTDTANIARGALVTAETSGARVHVLSAVLNVEGHSAVRPDTVVNVQIAPFPRTFIFDPTLPPTFSGIRIGGVPAWRTILQLLPNIRFIRLPCPGEPPGCNVSLDSVHINLAQLILRPAASPAGFVPEDSVVLDMRSLSPSATVPIERSALGATLSGSRLLAPSLFRAPAATDVVPIDLTSYLRHLTDDTIEETARLRPVFALLQAPEAFTFGFMTFEAEPMLRLILTKTTERQP